MDVSRNKICFWANEVFLHHLVIPREITNSFFFTKPSFLFLFIWDESKTKLRRLLNILLVIQNIYYLVRGCGMRNKKPRDLFPVDVHSTTRLMPLLLRCFMVYSRRINTVKSQSVGHKKFMTYFFFYQITPLLTCVFVLKIRIRNNKRCKNALH